MTEVCILFETYLLRHACRDDHKKYNTFRSGNFDRAATRDVWAELTKHLKKYEYKQAGSLLPKREYQVVLMSKNRNRRYLSAIYCILGSGSLVMKIILCPLKFVQDLD